MGYFSKFNKGKGIPFMDNRTKIDIPVDEQVHIQDYGFINGDDGEFVVLAFVEYPENFFFGNTIATNNIRTIESDLGSKEEALNMLKNVAIVFSKHESKNLDRKTKKPRVYTSMEFIEEEEEIPFA